MAIQAARRNRLVLAFAVLASLRLAVRHVVI